MCDDQRRVIPADPDPDPDRVPGVQEGTVMRHPQYVEFVDYRSSPLFYQPKWWDKPRWFLVRLLGGNNPHDSVQVTRIPISGEDFAASLFKQRRAIMETFRQEATTILVGGEDYEKLMNSPLITHSFQFSSSFNYGPNIYGLTVKVIPWMRGILVMP